VFFVFTSFDAYSDNPSIQVFVYPTEFRPQDAFPILSHSLPGIYLAVGFERAFMGAVFSKARALLIVDHSEDVIRFARINIALITVAKDREDYLALRLNGTPSDWRQRHIEFSGANEGLEVLSDGESWKWWDQAIRDSKDLGMELFHSTGGVSWESPFFLSYLTNDSSFYFLQEIARGERMWALQLELTNKKEVRLLVSKLEAYPLPIGVFDLSTAWEETFLSQAELNQLIAQLTKISEPRSMILLSNGIGESTVFRGEWDYSYLGLKWPSSGVVLDQPSIRQIFEGRPSLIKGCPELIELLASQLERSLLSLQRIKEFYPH